PSIFRRSQSCVVAINVAGVSERSSSSKLPGLELVLGVIVAAVALDTVDDLRTLLFIRSEVYVPGQHVEAQPQAAIRNMHLIAFPRDREDERRTRLMHERCILTPKRSVGPQRQPYRSALHEAVLHADQVLVLRHDDGLFHQMIVDLEDPGWH